MQSSLFAPSGVPPGGFDVIAADPPWPYDDRGQSGSMKPSGSATHYDTLTVLQIAGLPVPDIAARDSLLFLWVTGPQLEPGLRVMRSWGFDYRTLGFVWTKTGRKERAKKALRSFVSAQCGAPRSAISSIVQAMEPWLLPAFPIGQGSYTRANPELCLLGVRGRGVPRINAGVRCELLAPVGAHSEKPAEAYERITRLVGERTSRLEMFARTPRPGWSVWGNETLSDIELRVPSPEEFAWTTGAEPTALRVRRAP